MVAAFVPGRGLKEKMCIRLKPARRHISRVFRNCASVSPGRPTRTSDVSDMPGIAFLMRATVSR